MTDENDEFVQRVKALPHIAAQLGEVDALKARIAALEAVVRRLIPLAKECVQMWEEDGLLTETHKSRATIAEAEALIGREG